ncbi:MAG: thrombospondin type 3 repeat-containing protein [Lysobacteraceae bacterium]
MTRHATLSAALSAAIALTALAGTARGKDDTLRHVRLCDASYCYYAWNVVDSDGDGVCDADERVAGTDPHDPKSRPSPEIIATLVGKQMLPSFEFGLGKVILYPEKLQETIEAGAKDPLATFPVGERKDAMTRLGLSAELRAEHGIQVGEGFTLAQEFDPKGGAPYRRVGGIDVRLISDEDDDAGWEPLTSSPEVMEIYNYEDGSTGYKLTNGDWLYDGADGHGLRQDKDGKIIDQWYVNPDADTGAGGPPTDEQLKAWERAHGATVLTVQGHEPPTFDPDGLQKPRDLIVLIDPEYGNYSGMIQDAPRVTTAQPETRPDLPNPQVPTECGTFCGQ